MAHAINILETEGSRMDYEDLVEWQNVLLGGPQPSSPPAPPSTTPPIRIAPLPDPQHRAGRVWGSDGGDDE